MTEDSHCSLRHSTWLERLSYALLREPHDREQLVNLLRDAEQKELLDSDALGMIEGVLQVSEMQVRDIMIPRAQMVIVEEGLLPEKFLPVIIESAHSRFPVMNEERDAVRGILLAKDLLKLILHPKQFNMNDVLRPSVFIPESKRLNVLLKEFRLNRNHMAIVVDEYGGIAGLVTIEDVLEQIVGEIEDEYDIEEDDYIKQHSSVKYTVKALTPIETFNDFFHSDLEHSEFDTMGGLIMNRFGYLPKRGESVSIGHYTFKILHADNRRIRLVEAIIHESNIAEN